MPPVFRLLAGGCLALTVGMGVARFLYTPVLPLMQGAEGFGPDIAGLVGSANFLGYFVGSLAMSAVTSEPLRLRVFRLALIANVVVTVAMGLTRDPLAWMAIRAASGLASAACLIAAAHYVIEALAADKRERFVWLHWSGVSLGIAASALFVGQAAGALGWQQIWIAAGLAAAAATPVIWVTVKPWRHPPAVRQGPAPRAARPFPFLPLVGAYFCEGLGYSVFATFIVAILKARPGLEATADHAWIAVGLVGIPAALAWSRLSERIGYARPLALAFLAQAVGVALPALSDAPAVALLAAVLFGATFMPITLMILPLGRAGAGGRGIALLTAAFGLGQIVGPAAAGYAVAGGVGFGATLAVSAAVVALGMALVVAGIVMSGRHRAG